MDKIFNKQQLPGYNRKNRKIIYELIFSIFQNIYLDTKKIIRAFFPALADYPSLLIHAKALDLMVYPFDTKMTLRNRVMEAAFFKEEIGQRKTIFDFLNIYLPGRYQLAEYPKDSFRIGYSKIGVTRFGGGEKLVVKISNLSTEEKDNVLQYLDNTLDPDIEIYVLEETING